MAIKSLTKRLIELAPTQIVHCSSSYSACRRFFNLRKFKIPQFHNIYKHLGLLQGELTSQYLIVSTIPNEIHTKNLNYYNDRNMRLRGWS